MKPGEQKPHWVAPEEIQARCRGWSFPGVPSPSMVVIWSPSSTRFILYTQDRTNLPFKMTLQAPHCPVPHPTLVPVSPSCPRSTSARDDSPSTIRFLSTPFTRKRF